jgi:hypothetical protein
MSPARLGFLIVIALLLSVEVKVRVQGAGSRNAAVRMRTAL